MTLGDLIRQFDEAGIPHNWELKLELPTNNFDLKCISVIDQNEVGLVFEDHQRLTSLNEDPENYEVPACP